MGRGKIEIKKIENPTNRQVTYSKRRNGIIKKAEELTVLCDARVSLIMFSGTGRYHQYTSPQTSNKEIFDNYQKCLGIDLWSSHYEKMKENLRKLRDINNKLRRDIRQRMGEDLDDLNIGQMGVLEQRIEAALKLVRDKKFELLERQTNTRNKKVKGLEREHKDLLDQFGEKCADTEFEFAIAKCEYPQYGYAIAKCEDPQYGLVENEGDYESLASGASNLYAFRLHHHGGYSPVTLHHHAEGFGPHELRLA